MRLRCQVDDVFEFILFEKVLYKIDICNIAMNKGVIFLVRYS